MAPRYFASEFPNDNSELHAGAVWVVESPCAPAAPELVLERTQPISVARRSAAAAPATPATETTLEALLTEAVDQEPAEALISMIVPAGDHDEDVALVSESTSTPGEAPAPTASHVRMTEESPAPPEEHESFEGSLLEASANTPSPPAAEAVAHETADPFHVLIQTLAKVAADEGLALEASALTALLEGEVVAMDALPEAAVRGLVDSGLARHDAGTIVLSDASRATACAWRAIVREEEADFAACGSRMLDEWSADLVARLLGAPGKMDAIRRRLRARGVAAFGLLVAA